MSQHKHIDEWLLLFWMAHVSQHYAGLLGHDGWSWNPLTQEYVSKTGSRVDQTEQRAIAMLFIASIAEMMRNESAQLSTMVDMNAWQLRMSELIEVEYTLLAALAAGGIKKLTDKDREAIRGWESTPKRIGTGTIDADTRLPKFAEAIKSGTLTEKQIADRVTLYANAGYPIYEDVRENSHIRHGFKFERSILDPNPSVEHCIECESEDRIGWQPIGQMIKIGLRICQAGCRCTVQYAYQLPE